MSCTDCRASAVLTAPLLSESTRLPPLQPVMTTIAVAAVTTAITARTCSLTVRIGQGSAPRTIPRTIPRPASRGGTRSSRLLVPWRRERRHDAILRLVAPSEPGAEYGAATSRPPRDDPGARMPRFVHRDRHGRGPDLGLGHGAADGCGPRCRRTGGAGRAHHAPPGRRWARSHVRPQPVTGRCGRAVSGCRSRAAERGPAPGPPGRRTGSGAAPRTGRPRRGVPRACRARRRSRPR